MARKKSTGPMRCQYTNSCACLPVGRNDANHTNDFKFVGFVSFVLICILVGLTHQTAFSHSERSEESHYGTYFGMRSFTAFRMTDKCVSPNWYQLNSIMIKQKDHKRSKQNFCIEPHALMREIVIVKLEFLQKGKTGGASHL